MDVEAPARFEAVPVKTPADGPMAVELIPAPDPWHVARKLAHLPHLLFLDSAEKHTERGRSSYVMADPVEFTTASIVAGEEKTSFRRLDLMERNFRDRQPWSSMPELPPFQCGVAGRFGYGLGRDFERTPDPQLDDFESPDLCYGVYDWLVSFDHAH